MQRDESGKVVITTLLCNGIDECEVCRPRLALVDQAGYAKLVTAVDLPDIESYANGDEDDYLGGRLAQPA